MRMNKNSRAVLGAALATQLVLGPLTVRDVSRRSSDQVRGPKILWKLWGGTNLAGVAAYWLIGRRRTA